MLKIKSKVTFIDNPDKVLLMASKFALGRVLDYLELKFAHRIKQRHYTLSQLRKLGHPYARRYYGSINNLKAILNLMKQGNVHKVRLDVISKQSGKLSLKIRRKIVTVSLTRVEGKVYLDDSGVKYSKYVFFGTKRLIARPIHLLVKEQEGENALLRFNKHFARSFKSLAKKYKKTIQNKI